MARALDSGEVDIIYGTLDASAATTDSPNIVTVTDNGGEGDFTLTYPAFLSAPSVTCTPIGADSTATTRTCLIESTPTTTAVRVNCVLNTLSGTTSAQSDFDFCFFIVGKRAR